MPILETTPIGILSRPFMNYFYTSVYSYDVFSWHGIESSFTCWRAVRTLLTHSLTHSLLMPDDGDNDDDDGRLQRAVAHSNRRVQRFITATWRAPPTATYKVVFT